jgi:zinc protease
LANACRNLRRRLNHLSFSEEATSADGPGVTKSYQSFAYLGKGGVEPAINALVQENERARKFGFTASELDRVKKQLMKNIERSYNERDKTESQQIVEEISGTFWTENQSRELRMSSSTTKNSWKELLWKKVNQFAIKTVPATADP